ncbi:MAG: hypothetical protein AAGA46_03130 [Cyanobacteria bacterium P01_F01_bin.13]
MQTLLEFREVHSTEYRIIANDQNLGMISFSIIKMCWSYTPYGQPVKASGTLEQCKAAAQADLEEPEPLQVTVTQIENDVKPAYIHRRTSWRAHGPGFEQTVTVQADDETYKVLVPRSFARCLHVGSVVELHHAPIQGLFLRWTRKPVRRQAIAA